MNCLIPSLEGLRSTSAPCSSSSSASTSQGSSTSVLRRQGSEWNCDRKSKSFLNSICTGSKQGVYIDCGGKFNLCAFPASSNQNVKKACGEKVATLGRGWPKLFC